MDIQERGLQLAKQLKQDYDRETARMIAMRHGRDRFHTPGYENEHLAYQVAEELIRQNWHNL